MVIMEEKSWGIEGRPHVEALQPSGLAVTSSIRDRGMSSRFLLMRDSVEEGDRQKRVLLLTAGPDGPAEQTSWSALSAALLLM